MLTDPETSPQRALVGHLFVAPVGGGRATRASGRPERLLVLAGRVGFQLGTQRGVLDAGQSCEVPPGTPHDWWQVGEDEAQVLVDVAPGERFVQVVSTMFGLARDRKVNAAGLPHLLPGRGIAKRLPRHVRPRFPAAVDPARHVRRPGSSGGAFSDDNRPIPNTPSTGNSPEPDPAALSALDEHGRLRLGTASAP